MSFRSITYSLLLATLLVGCGDSPSMRQLNDLEACINDAPDSVLTVLTAADMPRWGEARALYALLTVQAQDKKGLDVVDDSLISVATRYYEHRGSALRRLQAFYYYGRVYANADHRHEAMTAYTRAKDFADEVDAPYPVGLLYAQMGVLYGNDYDYQRALEFMQEALRYYELAGKERLQYIAKRNIGLIYLNMQDAAQADSLLNEVLVWGEAHDDSYIINSTLYQLLCMYDATADIVSLDYLLGKYPIETALRSATTYGIIAHYHVLKGNIVAAEDALDQAWQMSTTAEDTAKLWHKSYQINKVLGRIDAALNDYERLFELQDSTIRITLQQPLIASQRDHYETRLKVEELRNQQQRYLTRGAAVVALMLAVALGIYVRRCLRKKDHQLIEQIELADELRYTLYNKDESIERINEELNHCVNLIEDLRHTLSDKEESIDRINEELQAAHAQLKELRMQLYANEDAMEHRVALLFREQYTLLDELCTTYYENPKDEQRRNEIFDRVSTIIDSFSSDEEYAKLETIVNECRDGVIARLRQELPKFKESDYRLLCYICAGLSMQTISVITQQDVEKLWVYKGRLIARIAKSTIPSKEVILSQIPQRVRKASIS